MKLDIFFLVHYALMIASYGLGLIYLAHENFKTKEEIRKLKKEKDVN
jgi:fructose-1,6-bisphosphatase